MVGFFVANIVIRGDADRGEFSDRGYFESIIGMHGKGGSVRGPKGKEVE